MRSNILILALLLAAPTARPDEVSGPASTRLEALQGAPPFPADNPPTPEKIRLGKELFFENDLSGGGRRSCSTCHKPELNFTDGFSRGWGLNESELRRKTPGLLNVGWQRSMFFDSRVDKLEEQVSKPLEHPNEMNLDPAEAVERIARKPYYQRLFGEAFPGEEIRFELIAKAIASYERTLVSYDSDLDRYLLGDETALSAEALRGMALFEGKAGCIRCHNGPLLTDHQRHYTGVSEERGDNAPGFKYKTQSLRDVTRRYSFMHAGQILRIEDALDHYQRGGSAPEGLQAEIKPFDLSALERTDLIAFLSSLNGRVNELIDASPKSRDVFSLSQQPKSGPVTEDPPMDPNYPAANRGAPPRPR